MSSNRFLLCRMVSTAARKMHRSGTRVEDTIKTCLKLCKQGEPNNGDSSGPTASAEDTSS